MPNDGSDVIREQPVKADILKSQVGARLPQLMLPVRPKRKRRVAAADRVLPAMWQRDTRLIEIAEKPHTHAVPSG